MSFSRWVVRQRRGGREMTRGARSWEETTEWTNEKWERRARSEGKLRDSGGRCSGRTLDCRWRKMRVIVTTAVDTSPLIFSPAIYRFCPHFFLFDQGRILSYMYKHFLFIDPLKFFSLLIPFADEWNLHPEMLIFIKCWILQNGIGSFTISLHLSVNNFFFPSCKNI